MNHLNSIILEGNIVKDGELTEPKAAFTVCTFPIAVNRKSRNAQGELILEVSYFDIECYGQMAQMAEKHCKKGKGVRVVGRLKQSVVEEDGVKKSKVYVVAEHIEYKFSKPAEVKAEKTA